MWYSALEDIYRVTGKRRTIRGNTLFSLWMSRDEHVWQSWCWIQNRFYPAQKRQKEEEYSYILNTEFLFHNSAGISHHKQVNITASISKCMQLTGLCHLLGLKNTRKLNKRSWNPSKSWHIHYFRVCWVCGLYGSICHFVQKCIQFVWLWTSVSPSKRSQRTIRSS